MFCSVCSRRNKEGSKFCKYCGAVQNEAYDDNILDCEKKSKSGTIINIGILLGAVCIVALLYVYGNYHECNNCGKRYIGSAYYHVWNNEDIMCEECAKSYYKGLDYTRFRVE